MALSVDIKKLQEDICINDSQKAFTNLFNHFYSRLFEVSKHYVKVSHLAEEVVSDVFLKLWNNRKKMINVQDLKAYLFIAVKRQSLNALRDNRKNYMFIDSLEDVTIVELKNPESDMFSDEFLEYFSSCISNLPEKCRIVFKLVKEENMKYKEVADILNLSEKTIEMHMALAFKQLRNDLYKLNKKVNIK